MSDLQLSLGRCRHPAEFWPRVEDLLGAFETIYRLSGKEIGCELGSIVFAIFGLRDLRRC